VAFSPDGRRVVTGSENGTARLWDALTGQPIGEPMKHDGPIHSAQFSPDGSKVLTASGDKTARLWDAASGKELAAFHHDGDVNSAVFSPDGQRVVTASKDGTSRWWDLATGKLVGAPEVEQKPVQSPALPQKPTVNIETASGQIDDAAKAVAYALAGAGFSTNYNKVLAPNTTKPTLSFNPNDRQFADKAATILKMAGVAGVVLRPDDSYLNPEFTGRNCNREVFLIWMRILFLSASS
jgi:WD40 repeat protein